MNKNIKKNIRIISEKYEYEMLFIKDFIVLKNSTREIVIKNGIKDKLIISTNIKNESVELEISPQYIFDNLINLFEDNYLKFSSQNTELITLNLLYTEEGNSEMWIEEFNKAKKDELENGNFHKEIGGNRILIEYYKGVLILKDDLNNYASNIIEWKKNEV